VADDRAQALRVALVLRGSLLEVDRLDLIDALEPDVLLGESDLDLLAQDLRVEHVLHADAETRRLVGVGGADPPPRRADLQLPEPPLRGLVHRDVPGHDQVCVSRQDDDRRVDPASLELVEFADQHLRVDDAAAADHGRLAGDDTARRLPDLVRLAVDDDRVPGIGPALVAADHIRALREQVDDLALALVPPLRADDDGRRHALSLDGFCEHPADAVDDDAVPAATGDEADVGLPPQRALDATRIDVERPPVEIAPAPAPGEADLARRLEPRRLRPDPDMLALAHTICSWRASGRPRGAGVLMRRTTTSWPAEQ